MALKDKLLNGIGLNKLITNIKNLVKPNPALAGTESDLTGLEVNGIKYAVPQVEANPTIPSGTTPTALEGLKVGSDYFSAGGGDVHLYQHDVLIIMQSGALTSAYFALRMFSTSSVALTKQSLYAALNPGQRYYALVGKVQISSSPLTYREVMYLNRPSNTTDVYLGYHTENQPVLNTVKFNFHESGVSDSVSDTVTQIL